MWDSPKISVFAGLLSAWKGLNRPKSRVSLKQGKLKEAEAGKCRRANLCRKTATAINSRLEAALIIKMVHFAVSSAIHLHRLESNHNAGQAGQINHW